MNLVLYFKINSDKMLIWFKKLLLQNFVFDMGQYKLVTDLKV